MIEAEAKLDEDNCLLRLGAQALQVQCSENYFNDKQLGRGKPSRWHNRKDSFYIIQSVRAGMILTLNGLHLGDLLPTCPHPPPEIHKLECKHTNLDCCL